MVFKYGDLEYNSLQDFFLGGTPTFKGKKVVGGPAPVIAPVGAFTKMFGTGSKFLPGSIPNLPWRGIAIGGGGLLAGWGISSFFGGKEKKQEQQLTQQQQPIQITKTYSPVTTTTTTQTFANTYQIAENSPGAYLSLDKKDTVQTSPSVGVSPSWAISPSQAASQGAEQGQAEGSNLLIPAAILGIALIASGYLKGRKAT